MAINEGGFKFERDETGGWSVYLRGKCIGTIQAAKEINGRHCFTLGCDKNKPPRTYRGKLQAAEALKVIDSIKKQAEKGKWSMEVLITQSWAQKPQSVAQ
jgi:hypothetical protein